MKTQTKIARLHFQLMTTTNSGARFGLIIQNFFLANWKKILANVIVLQQRENQTEFNHQIYIYLENIDML